MAPKIIKLGPAAITDHAFSADHSLLAVARRNEVELYYEAGRGKYERGADLQGHDKVVTSVDIGPNFEIVTCSQDRNALVWQAQQDGTWKPTLVLLRINRAATYVRWSPDGSKFAVGSGARVIAVCWYDTENDWWISKHIKKPLKSTVLSVAWHPNSILLAAGSTDGHARVFSGYVKGVDAKPEPTLWGDRLPFQTLCGDFADDTDSWVHDVAFSPSGDALAWTTHDSSVLVAYPGGPGQPPRAVVQISTSFLPFRSLTWTSDSQIVAGGFDNHPVMFEGSENGWNFARSIDDPASHSDQNAGASDEQNSALHMFRQLDLKGTQNETTKLPTIHQNAIATVRSFAPGQVSTSGDGQVVIFSV